MVTNIVVCGYTNNRCDKDIKNKNNNKHKFNTG